MSELSFGVWFAPTLGFPKSYERWKLFEDLGFDSVWAVDHFTNPIQPDVTPWLECWTILAALAARTKKIRIGTMVTNIIYRNPAIIAKQALSVDHISGGRLTVGIGAGSPKDVSHRMTGVKPWSNRERVERFKEIIEIYDLLLTNEVSSYEGEYYQLKDVVMKPFPVQRPRPPLAVAAKGPKMLKLAATHAETWNTLPGYGLSGEEALKRTSERNEKVTEYAIEAGRDPDSITRSLFTGWSKERPFESGDAFTDFVNRYREIGINEFILGFWTDEEDVPGNPLHRIGSIDMLEEIANELIPQLKS